MANLRVENDSFFDVPEEIFSESDTESDDSEPCSSEQQQVPNNVLRNLHTLHHEFWKSNVKSIDERRDAFMRKTGFELDRCHTAREGPDEPPCISGEKNEENDEKSSFESTTSVAKTEENQSGSDRFEYSTQSGSDRFEYSTQSGSDRFEYSTQSESEFEKPKVDGSERQRRKLKTIQKKNLSSDQRKQQFKEGWFKRLSFRASNMFNKEKEIKEIFHHHKLLGSKKQRVRVSSHKKWGKELTSLYRKQEFLAHKGSILAIKFSIEGNYLATGGEDGFLKVWEVVEDEKVTDFDLVTLNAVSGCLNFSVNGIPNMACFLKFNEDGKLIDKLKNNLNSAGNGVMIPRKEFRIVEKPLHEFHGHVGDILDISWSKTEHLISSSIDKTVRLWKVGHNRCLRVFPHNDFVTCAQFNPMDGDIFISGSIDGKVRIWDVHRCQVVDWIDFKEIVTAICYRPDGKGGIVGSMAGNCTFFDIADDQRSSIIYVQRKKMIGCKRITGFQFSPNNPSDVVVSSADNLVRVLKGTDIICKYRESLPLIDKGSQVFASFTADGKHIIAATNDSNVYVWNHITHAKTLNGKSKNVWSSESFISQNALIAVPWHGIRTPSTQRLIQESPDLSKYQTRQDEGNEQRSSSKVVMPIVNYDLLRNVCESIVNGSHMWGVVIVTGGKDGIIRTYHNYGLPIRYPTGKSLRSTLSFSNIRNRFNRNSLSSSLSMGR